METITETGARGTAPWDGLGFTVEKRLPVKQFLKKAGLNWTVGKRPIIVPNDPADPVTFIDHYAMTREFPDGKVEEFGICGKQYIPTQNEEAFDFFDKYCTMADLKFEAVGALCGGKQIFALAKIPNDDLILPGDDLVSPYLLLSHPHIWGKGLNVKWTPIRVYCMNTLAAALAGGSDFNMRHIYAFDPIMRKRAVEQVEAARSKMIEFAVTARFLASKEYTDDTLFRYIADQFQPDVANDDTITADKFKRNAYRVLTLVHSSPGANLTSAKNTWWGALNGVTYFFDHEYGNTQDGRLDNAWFGANAGKKLRALDLAYEYAKAA